LFPMRGRVFSVRFSADGKRIACGSGLDRAGEALVCSYDFTNDGPKALLEIMGMVPGNRKPQYKKQLEDCKMRGIRELARVSVPIAASYAVAFSPDGSTVAAAGSDGKVRFLNTPSGAVMKVFVSGPFSPEVAPQSKPAWSASSKPIAE